MKRFVNKAIEKIARLDKEQIRSFLTALAADNELLKMVFDSMLDGVIVTGSQHKILLYNKSAKRMIPFVKGDAAGKLIWKMISDREIAGFFKEKLVNQEKVKDREFTLDNGLVRTLSCTLMPLVLEGTIRGNVLHIEDVTDKRAKEARLRRAENLAALTTLAAGVAHEIKNPLASIGIHLQLIKREVEGKKKIDTKPIIKCHAVLTEEVDRLNRIVVDFLFAVRPMDTRLKINDLNRVIRDLLDFLKFELDQSRIGVELNLSRYIPEIELDEKYMKQALLNIIKNAISAMPDGGQLIIETLQQDDELQLKVTDTGTGIPDDIIGKIFEPYFTTKDFGSGLGLTLVYKIVKEHKGDIAIKTKEGEGTTFTLSFPIPLGEKRLIGFKGETV
jgi:PAS domain S-box-containing protein